MMIYTKVRGSEDPCKERVNIPKGIFASYDALSGAIAKSDVYLLAPKIEMPVFIIHGADDYSTSY
ncbi:hypothetical protein [Priestia flexa]|uniref:hypothetical protein n=1 Tax=Priestia flexa TaxID=86664 RepID=UPI00288E332C|nr:hypothetical protein [Priestia flexa]MDT2046625.1 hypothetical protein [Priestia flexa]